MVNLESNFDHQKEFSCLFTRFMLQLFSGLTESFGTLSLLSAFVCRMFYLAVPGLQFDDKVVRTLESKV